MEQYETIREALDDRAGLRMFYLDGTLELMSPSRRHEEEKKVIARLLEAGPCPASKFVGYRSQPAAVKAYLKALRGEQP